MKSMRDAFQSQARVLETLSYQGVLARGFALVTGKDGYLVRSAGAISEGDALRLRFADGEVAAQAGQGGPLLPRPPAPATPDASRPRIRRAKRGGDSGTGDLF